MMQLIYMKNKNKIKKEINQQMQTKKQNNQ